MTADLKRILASWPISPVRDLRPASAGTNNHTWRVETAKGPYILRVYQNTANLLRIRYEHELLGQLGAAGLSFAVPTPLVASSGETVVPLSAGGREGVAALFPVIVGLHPIQGNLVEAALAGEALGELDQALARLPLGQRPPPLDLPTYGALDRIHPLVPEPRGMLDTLPIESGKRARVIGRMEQLQARAPAWYASLPRQLVHADFARSNCLLVGRRINGILDFEFAGPDLRAIDPVTGLFSFVMDAWGTGREWGLIEALLGGYSRRDRLAPEELAALPDLLRLRDVTALIHRVGRLRQGLTTPEQIVERVDDLLRLDDWLNDYTEEFLSRMAC